MPKGTDTRCKVCNSGYRKEIERMIVVEGKSYSKIIEIMQAKGISLNIANLSKHKKNHMMMNVDTLREISKSRASLMPVPDVTTLTPEQLLDYVVQEAMDGIEALKLLPTSHYTLAARNNFLSTIRQIAEARLKVVDTDSIKDVTQIVNEQLKARGLLIDVPKDAGE